MKHKFISTQSGKLLAYFNELGKPCFGYAEAFEALPGSKEGAMWELLSDMTRRGLLMRLKKAFIILSRMNKMLNRTSRTGILSPNIWFPDTNYYIGYYSALQIHNLITQPSLKEQIVVAKQIRPSEIKIKNVPFQFIYHNEKHFFGAKKIWIDNFNRVSCSDLEKTFIDCLFKPEYAGGDR
jgi:predicted transcriptional regulator of viral defense system